MAKSEAVADARDTHDKVRNAEQRAERAEKRVEQLERAVAELKSERTGSARNQNENHSPRQADSDPPEDVISALRREPMMTHLMDALAEGKDIGHYGRLVFAMVAHHFMPPDQVLEWLNKDQDFSHDEAVALLRQVETRDYNPPRRERILAWQAEQEFPILPNVDDPDCGNVYRNLKFPDKVYEHIQEYQEEKAEAESPDAKTSLS